MLCMLHAACCMLHAACCMVHVARRDAAMQTTAVVRCCNDCTMFQLQRRAHAPTKRYSLVAATSLTRRSRVLIMLVTYDAAASYQGAACRRLRAIRPSSGPSRARTSRATVTASSVRIGRRGSPHGCACACACVRACGRVRACVRSRARVFVCVHGCVRACLCMVVAVANIDSANGPLTDSLTGNGRIRPLAR